MSNILRVTTFKGSNESFLDSLKEHNIKYNSHIKLSADPIASGITIDIIITGGWGAIAVACIAWATFKKSRKINITTKNNESIWLEGYSAKDAEKILESARRVEIIDTKKNENA